jgi:hypothetical protein
MLIIILVLLSIGAFSPFGCNTTKIKGTVYYEYYSGGVEAPYTNIEMPGVT